MFKNPIQIESTSRHSCFEICSQIALKSKISYATSHKALHNTHVIDLDWPEYSTNSDRLRRNTNPSFSARRRRNVHDEIYCRLYHQYAEYANNGSETMVPSEDLRWCIGCVGKTMCRVYPRPRVNTTSYLHSRNITIAPPPSKRSSPASCITPTKCTRRGISHLVVIKLY